jgi:ribonuclease P protein component
MLKPNVLRRKSDFSALYNKGKSVGDRYVVVFCRKNQLGFNRTAFLASKKVGNSVERNRARRLMKESYRHLEGKILQGFDIIIIARNTIHGTKCHEVQKSLKSAITRAGLRTNGKAG